MNCVIPRTSTESSYQVRTVRQRCPQNVEVESLPGVRCVEKNVPLDDPSLMPVDAEAVPQVESGAAASLPHEEVDGDGGHAPLARGGWGRASRASARAPTGSHT